MHEVSPQPQRDPVKLVCTALSTFGKTVVGSLNHSNTYSSRHTNQCIFIETAACESCLNRRCCQRDKILTVIDNTFTNVLWI
jgi:hypothetical protein